MTMQYGQEGCTAESSGLLFCSRAQISAFLPSLITSNYINSLIAWSCRKEKKIKTKRSTVWRKAVKHSF